MTREVYDYREEMYKDIKNFFDDNPDEKFESWDHNYDLLWCDDSITGNGSGSYTFNRWIAEQYVKDNFDLLIAAIREFGDDLKTVKEKIDNEEWEWMDVTIRCYLLSEVLSNVREEMEV